MTQKSNDWFEVSKAQESKQKHINVRDSLTTSQIKNLHNVAASTVSCDTHGDPKNEKHNLEDNDPIQKSNVFKHAHSFGEDIHDEDDNISSFKGRKSKPSIYHFKKEDVEGVNKTINFEKDQQETYRKGDVFTSKASDIWFNFK